MKPTIPILTLFFLISCECKESNTEMVEAISSDPYLDSLLSRAIEDALVAEVSEEQNLHVIPDSIMKDTLNRKYVKGVTWLNKKHEPGWVSASKKKDKKYILPENVAVWITIFPKVRDFCNDQIFESSDQLKLRLKQRLGLDYKVEYSYLAEVWVPISHLMRPCLDPDISKAMCLAEVSVKLDSDQSEWFFEQRSGLKKPNAVPFTGLGYTYDWGSADTEVGFTEFVFMADGKEPILVDGLYTLEDYCTML